MESQCGKASSASVLPAAASSDGAADPVLRIRLLGELSLQVGGSALPPLESARAESLLAYLLLHRDAPQPRQRIAFVLWPDSSEPQARTNLRHVLHNLRRSLPDADRLVEVGQRTLQWRADAPLWLDVAVFEKAIADGRLEEAVEAYRGDLLEGSYDDWLLEERERLAQLHVEALERLARRFEEDARWDDATRYAERLLREDPLREETYRLLMRLHDAAGDRARALRVYHDCVATLERELGVEPSAATREAYEALLPVAPEPGGEWREAGSLAGPRLVGRAAERARLSELWRAAERGQPRLVLVTGEAGVGKTRLLEELRAWCDHRGAVTAEARAYPVEGAMAYGAMIAWLRSERIAARIRRGARPHQRELARLLPELLTDVPELAPPEPLSESEQRQRLFDAGARAILAAGSPLLLVADDLQWFDAQTLQFTHYLLRAEPEARLLVAATARREEIDASDAVGEFVAGVQALGVCEEVALERLSRAETVTLAERVAGRALGKAEAGRLFDESEGNPLFVIEAVRAGLEAGSRAAAGGSRARAVIAARLAQLPGPAAELVGLAATIGREFAAEVLAEASEADEHAFVSGLDELWRRGLVRARGPSAYDFSHGKICEAAYAALGPAQARRHHLRVAQALERSRAADPHEVSGQIAAHYDRAGFPAEAVAWYERAADAAQRLHANEDAVRLLERALELVGAVPDAAALELRLLTALPAPLVAVEGYASPRFAAVHERALDLAGALGGEPEAPLLRSLALASLARGDFDAARSFGEQLRVRGEREGDDVLLVEGAYVLGVAAYWQSRLEDARIHLEAAVERCRPEHRAAHLLRYAQDPEIVCLTRLAHVLWLVGEDERADRASKHGLALAGERGHPYSHAVAAVWTAILALDQGDEGRLRSLVPVLDAADPEHGPPQTRLAAEAFAGLVDVVDGRTKEGIERVEAAVAQALSIEPAAPGFHGVVMRVLLEAYAATGEAEAGLRTADEALAMGGGAQLWEAESRRLRAGFVAALGMAPAEVEAELERAVAVAQRQGALPFERRARADLERLHAGTL